MNGGICEFHYDQSIERFLFVIPNDSQTCPSESSEFDQLLVRQWNNAKQLGVFKYNLNLLFKMVSGRFGLTAQLNCERAKHRRKPHHFKSIRDLFDPRRFNFSKIEIAEVLVKLISSEPLDREMDANLQEDSLLDAHIIINNSPISVGHSLLVPYKSGSVPQILTRKSVKLAVQLMLLSSCRFFHVVFNSILALASVNHLHLHLYYWPYSSKIVHWPVFALCPGLYVIKDWILPGFVLQLRSRNIDSFCSDVYKIVRYLNESETPHNLFMARAPELTESNEERNSSGPLYVTCYLFPRKPMYGTKPITTLAPAACEMGGHILVYSTWAFQELTEEKVLRIFDEALLEPGQFEKHCDSIKDLFID